MTVTFDTDRVKVFFKLVQDEDGYPPVNVESVWAQREGVDFRLDNIPFFVRGVSCEDTISAEERDGRLEYIRLLKSRGHSTVRVIFFDKNIVENVRESLQKKGCGTERMKSLVAIDIPENASYDSVMALLLPLSDEHKLEIEEATIRHQI